MFRRDQDALPGLGAGTPTTACLLNSEPWERMTYAETNSNVNGRFGDANLADETLEEKSRVETTRDFPLYVATATREPLICTF